MVETLGTLYANCDNPLLIALKLFANCPDCINVKNKSLPFTSEYKIMVANKQFFPRAVQLLMKRKDGFLIRDNSIVFIRRHLHLQSDCKH